MRNFCFPLIAACLVGGCAENELRSADARVQALPEGHVPILSSFQTLPELSNYAALLSESYRTAGVNIAFAQDATSLVTLLTAASAATGLADGVAERTIGRRATAGIFSGVLNVRYFDEQTIRSIYAASKQLNCVATLAGLASAYVANDNEAGFVAAAPIATRGAIRQIQIMARESVVRDGEDFNTLFEAFKQADTLNAASAIQTAPYTDATTLAYLADLEACIVDNKGPQNTKEANSVGGEGDTPDVIDINGESVEESSE